MGIVLIPLDINFHFLNASDMKHLTSNHVFKCTVL